MKKVLIFDCDGILVDPSMRDYHLYVGGLREQGLDPLPFKRYWTLRRRPMTTAELMRDVELDLSRFRQYRFDNTETEENLRLDEMFPCVPWVLAECSKKYDCRVVSSRFRQDTTDVQLARLGITRYFSSIHALAGPKLEFIRGIPNVHAVVGDTEHDVLPAKELGVLSLAIATGIRCREFLEGLNPTHVFDDLSQVLEVL